MKDKEKQIEEMARTLGGCHTTPNCKTCDEKSGSPSCYNKTGANNLYNAGYRKLPENSVIIGKERFEALETIEKYHIKSCGKDSVVISKEEYEVLKIKEKEKHWFETCISVWRNAKIDSSKETAEKCYEFIKNWVGNDDEEGLGFLFDFEEFIKKHFDVEVKE